MLDREISSINQVFLFSITINEQGEKMKKFESIICVILAFVFLSYSSAWAGNGKELMGNADLGLFMVVFLLFVTTLFIAIQVFKKETILDGENIVKNHILQTRPTFGTPIMFNVRSHGVKYAFFPIVDGVSLVCPFIKNDKMMSTVYRDNLHSGKKREKYVKTSIVTSLKKCPDFFNKINDDQERFGRIEIVNFSSRNIWGLTNYKKETGGRNEKTLCYNDSC